MGKTSEEVERFGYLPIRASFAKPNIFAAFPKPDFYTTTAVVAFSNRLVVKWCDFPNIFQEKKLVIPLDKIKSFESNVSKRKTSLLAADLYVSIVYLEGAGAESTIFFTPKPRYIQMLDGLYVFLKKKVPDKERGCSKKR